MSPPAISTVFPITESCNQLALGVFFGTPTLDDHITVHYITLHKQAQALEYWYSDNHLNNRPFDYQTLLTI